MPEPATLHSSGESGPAPMSCPLTPGCREGPETHLTDYVKVLYKRRWTAFTAFALVVGSITVYTFTATPIYEARTRLLLEAEQQRVVPFKEVVPEDEDQGGLLPTPVQRTSRAGRWRAGRSKGSSLWNTPPFGGTSDQGFSLTSAILGGPVFIASLFKGGDGSAAKEAADS